jgi:hypothetical protein
VHGARYAFAPKRIGVVRGLPTAYAAPVLASRIFLADDDIAPVWADAHGERRGEGLEPLYPSAPVAAREDPKTRDSTRCSHLSMRCALAAHESDASQSSCYALGFRFETKPLADQASASTRSLFPSPARWPDRKSSRLSRSAAKVPTPTVDRTPRP